MPRIPIVWYLLIASLGYIIFLKSCQRSCPSVTPTEIVKHDTVKIVDKTKTGDYKPVPVSVTPPDTQYMAMWVDTAAILSAYLSKVAYKDTVRNKYGYVLIIDTIHENRVADRRVDFHLEIPQVTLTSAIQPRNQVYGGITLGALNLPTGIIPGIGAELLLKTKSDKIYHVNAMMLSNGSKFYSGTADFKFHL